MNKSISLLAVAFIFGASSLCGSAAHGQEVHVFVSRQPASTPGESVYRYRVVNNSTQLITTVHLGWDYFNAKYTLNVPPSGWSRENGLGNGSVGSPPNWSAELLTTEETDIENSLEWHEDERPFSLLPGQMASGFTVTAPTGAAAYQYGIWTVVFAGPSEQTAALAGSGHLELDDRPPSLENEPSSEPSVTALNLADSASDLSGGQGSWRYYKVAVPIDTPMLQVHISGGSGDADLYVKRGALPNPRSSVSAAYIDGNSELFVEAHPEPGDWYIGVHGSSAPASRMRPRRADALVLRGRDPGLARIGSPQASGPEALHDLTAPRGQPCTKAAQRQSGRI